MQTARFLQNMCISDDQYRYTIFFTGDMQKLCAKTVHIHGGELYFDSDELPLSTQFCSLTLQAASSEDKLSLFFTSYSVGVDCIHTNVTFIDSNSSKTGNDLWPGILFSGKVCLRVWWGMIYIGASVIQYSFIKTVAFQPLMRIPCRQGFELPSAVLADKG